MFLLPNTGSTVSIKVTITTSAPHYKTSFQESSSVKEEENFRTTKPNQLKGGPGKIGSRQPASPTKSINDPIIISKISRVISILFYT